MVASCNEVAERSSSWFSADKQLGNWSTRRRCSDGSTSKNPPDIPQAVAIMLRLLTPAKVKRLIDEAEGNSDRKGSEDENE
jgi:hypothetical protein